MKKKTKVKTKAKSRKLAGEADTTIQFRERRLSDIIKNVRHPKPIPGYKATLPGPPGWQYKQDPGA